MPAGQIVIGPPGAGKTTYCWGLQQFFSALSRPVSIINLDPASPSPPYDCALDISELITLDDAMGAFGLGPNGGLLYCMEYLEAHVDWLLDGLERLKREDKADFLVFDVPGQAELSTNHDSLKNVIAQVEKAGWRLAAIHLTDATHIVDASKYVSIVLLSLRAMLQLGIPHVNVLSKIDLLEGLRGQLELNLDFYTEVQDLSYLLPLLDRMTNPKMAKLNRVIIDLIEDFGLVGFETLCVEDKMSMMHLVGVVDKALGYHPPPPPASSDGPDLAHHHHHHHHHPPSGTLARDVQEKYVDFAEEYAAWEKQKWEAEGDRVAQEATERSQKEAMERAKADKGHATA